MNLREALQDTASQLAVSDEPRVEAEHLLLAATGRRRTELFSHPDTRLDHSQQKRLNDWVRRRQNGEPLAYILGETEFYGRTFTVSPAVLIPRADTETLVDWALELILTDHSGSIIDLGTGSGCIAVSLACERPQAQVLATDVSEKALAVASQNAEMNRAGNVRFQHSSWWNSISGSFDLVVSNPPYIDAASPYLSQGDLPFEPEQALTPGDDGLAAIRNIISDAGSHLLSGGWLLLEHGFDQGTAVRKLLHAKGFRNVETRQDLTGNDRVSGGCLKG